MTSKKLYPGIYEKVVWVTAPDGTESTFSSYSKMCKAIPEMSINQVYTKKKPTHYKGYFIRKVPFNLGV